MEDEYLEYLIEWALYAQVSGFARGANLDAQEG